MLTGKILGTPRTRREKGVLRRRVIPEKSLIPQVAEQVLRGEYSVTSSLPKRFLFRRKKGGRG